MNLEEILQEIGIKKKAEPMEDDCLVVSLKNSDEYGRVYSILENSDMVEIDDDSSMLTYKSSSIQYNGDGFLVTLISDFDADTYKLTIKGVQ